MPAMILNIRWIMSQGVRIQKSEDRRFSEVDQQLQEFDMFFPIILNSVF